MPCFYSIGYKMYDSSPQRTFADTCEPCRPGYFGNHVNRQSCAPCRAGVVCLETSTTDVPLANYSVSFGVNATMSYPCPGGE